MVTRNAKLLSVIRINSKIFTASLQKIVLKWLEDSHIQGLKDVSSMCW